MKKISLFILASFLLVACGAYKYLDLGMLTTGMTVAEVENLMGPPNRVLAVNKKGWLFSHSRTIFRFHIFSFIHTTHIHLTTTHTHHDFLSLLFVFYIILFRYDNCQYFFYYYSL